MATTLLPCLSIVAHCFQLLLSKPLSSGVVKVIKAERLAELIWIPLQVLDVLQQQEQSHSLRTTLTKCTTRLHRQD